MPIEHRKRNGNSVRVLIVDDEKAIRRFLHTALEAQGYDVREVATGEAAIDEVITYRPDVMILDLKLPNIDGIQVIKNIREWSSLPIIVLSVRAHERDKVAALDAGADDYLTKPFGTKELLARLRASLRRVAEPESISVFEFETLTVDLAHRRVLLDGEDVQLTPTEYDILRVLVVDAGKVITHRQLLDRVWGPGYENATHLLRVNISNLRHKLEPNPAHPRYILTEPGVGYRMRADF
jgi:two-component system KDP operon response regulator KdpE